MKIKLRNDITKLVFTFDGVEYSLTNKFGRIIEDPSEAFIAFVESRPELEIESDDESDDSAKKKSKKSKE